MVTYVSKNLGSSFLRGMVVARLAPLHHRPIGPFFAYLRLFVVEVINFRTHIYLTLRSATTSLIEVCIDLRRVYSQNYCLRWIVL